MYYLISFQKIRKNPEILINLELHRFNVQSRSVVLHRSARWPLWTTYQHMHALFACMWYTTHGHNVYTYSLSRKLACDVPWKALKLYWKMPWNSTFLLYKPEVHVFLQFQPTSFLNLVKEWICFPALASVHFHHVNKMRFSLHQDYCTITCS